VLKNFGPLLLCVQDGFIVLRLKLGFVKEQQKMLSFGLEETAVLLEFLLQMRRGLDWI